MITEVMAKNLVDRVCEYCRKPFKTEQRFVDKGVMKCCSMKCQGLNRKRPMETILKSFIDKSNGPDACWPWTGYRTDGGYGQIRRDGKNMKAHRVVFQFINGPLLENECVLHRCDNPPCCNPTHLFKGSQADNMADMRTKGRGRVPSGAKNPNAKFSVEDIEIIRKLVVFNPDINGVELAECLNVSNSTVYNILNGVTYKPSIDR